jgi:phosphatidate cytidylyltransferase
MKKIVQRLLVFALGLPIIMGIVLFLPHYNHLVLNIVVVFFSALGAVEFAAILRRKGIALHPVEAAILGLLGPGAMTLVNSFGRGGQVFSAAFIMGASWLLVSRVFCSEEGLKNYTTRTAGGFSVMMYPGLFMAWVVRMTILPDAEKVILVFLLIVFANDSTAWAAGLLFGKGNRGIIPASPNKSIAGFIGGISAAIIIGAGAEILLVKVFESRFLPRSMAGIIIGLCTGVAATLGDLAESALKRSSGMKDSGAIIPGRGGVLDSIDSLSLAAPVFYVLYRLLF